MAVNISHPRGYSMNLCNKVSAAERSGTQMPFGTTGAIVELLSPTLEQLSYRPDFRMAVGLYLGHKLQPHTHKQASLGHISREFVIIHDSILQLLHQKGEASSPISFQSPPCTTYTPQVFLRQLLMSMCNQKMRITCSRNKCSKLADYD